jgi:hypothetical protein
MRHGGLRFEIAKKRVGGGALYCNVDCQRDSMTWVICAPALVAQVGNWSLTLIWLLHMRSGSGLAPELERYCMCCISMPSRQREEGHPQPSASRWYSSSVNSCLREQLARIFKTTGQPFYTLARCDTT